MALTLSPDHRTVLIDLQGLIFTMPAAGGTTKQVTSIFQEASHPDWSPKGDFVAIQSYAGGTFHIWTMHPDGTGLHQLTTGHGDDREPRISADGRTIAFASDRAFKGSYDIWTVNVASGALKQITSAKADEFGPTWTPDGSGIAFISGTGITGRSIEEIGLASGRQHTLVSMDPGKGRLEAPSFSPDGTRLAYVQFDGVGMFMNSAHLLVVNCAGDHSRVFTGKSDDTFPFPASWLSRDELLYTANGRIMRTDVTGGSEIPVPFQRVYSSHTFPVTAQSLRLRLHRTPPGQRYLRARALT